MLKKLIIAIFISFLSIQTVVFAADDDFNYTTLTVVDLNTFNEYRYKLTKEFFELRNKYEINNSIDKTIVQNILDIAKKGYNYLPDNLINENLFQNLKTSIERGIKYPNNSSNYTSITEELSKFIDKVNIEKITGNIQAFPAEGNAPLTVTFRANVRDSSGTKIPNYNYTWWMDVGGKRKVLSQTSGPSLNYTFTEEGNFTIFLDVKSNHKNTKGYTDVLPFRSREIIKINEKIASIILKVNNSNLRDREELKFTPEEARYGLLFDATSSTPTGGAKFTQTEWDFGNGLERKYSQAPDIERVIYSREGDYNVVLKLRTNEGKTIEKKFEIIIHDPIATINVNSEEGYLGDKFTFFADGGTNDEGLTYNWEIIDIENDKVVFSKTGKLFTYSFLEKGQYNVKLEVNQAYSNEPDVDTKVIYINSRAPVANFDYSIPYKNKPNYVLLDATKSYDPDFSDTGELVYNWVINGERVELENPNYNGSIGYYNFDSIGEHNVVLEVRDPDDITVNNQKKVKIDSILSVDFNIYPRVAIIQQSIKFISSSPEARVYYWDFGDGVQSSLESPNHQYKKSGIYSVKLKVIDKNDNENVFSRDVYIGDSDYPIAFININSSTNQEILYENGVCEGNGAYIVNRVNTVKFSAQESINVDGTNANLTYSWKLDNNKYFTTNSFDKKFDELGCFPISLTVKSIDNGKSNSKTIWVKVENIKPILSSVDFSLVDESSDPVVVKVNAMGAKDEDGIIQNYLWYYYTDLDSEPQDFRATKNPNTTFVLPKVTGNYYFVVVMKDNNQERVNSEDITGSKYFVTLTGDNLNIPIIDLNVNNSSISIGEEVVFTAKAQNILGNDISNKVEYSWDLDGDGFYDKETKTPIITHTFLTSGEYHIKVKVKNKGYSSTKSLTISVANILKPDFSYISIGSKFVILNNSKGSYSNTDWELGDGTKVSDKEAFIHEYIDNKTTHLVKLTIKESTKVKSYIGKAIKNMKNYLISRRSGFNYFSNFEVSDDTITLEQKENLYIYLGENKEAKYFGIDGDLSYDSDLNGGKDDDIDNKSNDSYSNGVILIELNNNKQQDIRLMIFDENKEIIDSYDLKIIKSYIEEKNIDINSINFSGISNGEKLKIEKLKNYISNIDSQYKLKALMYVQKLQEEWFDNRGKTNVILEFENYILEIAVSSQDDIINLLESLLVEGQDDQSEKSIMFNALKNLIPTGIDCSDIIELSSQETCYENLVSKLESININSNIDENKILGSEILKIIEVDTIMTNNQKIDFKAVLKTFVYGGLSNVPSNEIEPIKEVKPKDDNNSFMGLLNKFLYIILIIILSIFGIILIFYIWYKVSNKDSNIGFHDFIIDKTSQRGSKKNNVQNFKNDELDVLNELNSLEKDKNNNEEKQTKDIFNFENLNNGEKTPDFNNQSKNIENKEINLDQKEITQENKQKIIEKNENKQEQKENYENINEIQSKEKIEEFGDKKNKQENDKILDEQKIPDWLKGSFSAEENEKEIQVDNKIIKEEKNLEEKEQLDIDKEDIFDNQSDIEKKSIKDTKTITNKKDIIDKKEQKSLKAEIVTQEDLPTNEELDDLTNINIGENSEEKNIPDWLKGSFSAEEKVEETNNDSKISFEDEKIDKDEKEDNEKVIKIDLKDEKKDRDEKELSTKKQLKKDSNKKIKEDKSKKQVKKIKEDKSKKQVKQVKKENTEKTKEKTTEENKKENIEEINNTKKTTGELWEDGMKIPDWLKTDGDK